MKKKLRTRVSDFRYTSYQQNELIKSMKNILISHLMKKVIINIFTQCLDTLMVYLSWIRTDINAGTFITDLIIRVQYREI